MADSHLQVNHDGSTGTRRTTLWPTSKPEQEVVIKSIFEQNYWAVSSITNISGSHWKVKVACPAKELNINLYISSIRDESRQPDEFKMQLGNTYPSGIEEGWLNLVLGIYVINEEDFPVEYILSGYEISRYDFSTNPSIRGTRTAGLQRAKLFGMYQTEKSVLFRPEFLYYYIESQQNQDFVDSSARNVGTAVETFSSNEIFLTALRTKPFLLLAGISGTGKSRIVREWAFASCPKSLQDSQSTTPGNYCIIEVKPNWHDSTELLGYYSNLSGKYIFTKFTKFLVKAMKHPQVPFFVCLDEMNLAPVEQYLAEFLSVLETRKKVGNEIVSGALVDKEHFKGKTDDEWYKEFWGESQRSDLPEGATGTRDQQASYGRRQLEEHGLPLPDNVFVIGTVNMDDTTHQFSRKVIDRAMTIEMNGGNLLDIFGGAAKLEYKPDGDEWKLANFQSKYVSADEALAYSSLENYPDKDGLKNKLVDWLNKINKCLANTPFQVSYRVLNELVIYLAVLADEYGITEDNLEALVNRAVDDITLMKILPRIEGDEETLKVSDKEKKENNLVESIENKLQWLYSIMPFNIVDFTVRGTAVGFTARGGIAGEPNLGDENLGESQGEVVKTANQKDFGKDANDVDGSGTPKPSKEGDTSGSPAIPTLATPSTDVIDGRSRTKLKEMNERLQSVGFTRFWP